MEKIKPYLFWIICAVVLVAQLVYFGLILKPSPPDVGNAPRGLRPPADPRAAKVEAERRLRDLDALRRRAQTTIDTPPQNEVLDPAEADRLRNYIISRSWEDLLSRQVQDRERLVNDIRLELSNRSSMIGVPVSSQTDPVAWYADYQTATAALVRHLVDEGVLAMPTSMAGAIPTDDTYRSNRELRGVVSLITADGNQQQFSDASRRDQASREFRIIDRVARTLATVRISAEPHPLAEPFKEVRAPSETRVTIRSITVARVGSGSPQAYQVRMELSGTPSALLEASRVLDGLVDPIAVRLGSKWERRTMAPREKHNVADVPMNYSTELLVLDFFDPTLGGN